jgi:DNA polymerase III subunit delta'
VSSEQKSLPRSENWGLIGHEWAVDMLKKHIQNKSLRHATLLVGPPGVGRRTLALRLVQALNCSAPPAPGEACGVCRTCKQIEAMQFPDLTVVQAESEAKMLGVEQVREMLHSLLLHPYQAAYKVLLFPRFQQASPSTANILLKSLEEAPPRVLFILTADNVEQLLPTVVSRCEVMRLRPLPVEQLEAALLERGSPADQAHLLAHLSGGRAGSAIRMRDEKSEVGVQPWLEFRQQCLADLESLLKASRVERFAYAEKVTSRKTETKERFRNTLMVWLNYWRDVMISASGSSTPLVNVDHAASIAALAKKLGLEQSRLQVEMMETAIERLDRNVNQRLLAEVTLLDWPHA